MPSPPMASSSPEASSVHGSAQSGFYPPSLMTTSASILPPSHTQAPGMIMMQTPYGPMSVPISSLPAASPNPALALQHDPTVLLQMQMMQAQMQHLQPHYNMMGPSFFNGMAMAPSVPDSSSATDAPDTEMDGTAFLEALFGSEMDTEQPAGMGEEVEDEEAKAKLRDLAILMSPSNENSPRARKSRVHGPLSPSRHSEPPRDSVPSFAESWSRRSPTLKIATAAQAPSGDATGLTAVTGRAPSATVYVNPRFVPKHGGSIDLNALTATSALNAANTSSLPKVLPKFNLEKMPFVVPLLPLPGATRTVATDQDVDPAAKEEKAEEEEVPKEMDKEKESSTTDALSRWHAVIKALIDEEHLPAQEQWWTATVADFFPRSNLPSAYTGTTGASISLAPRPRTVSDGLSSPLPTTVPPGDVSNAVSGPATDEARVTDGVPAEQVPEAEPPLDPPATKEPPPVSTSSPLLKRKAALMASQEHLAALDAPILASAAPNEGASATEDHPMSPPAQPSRRHSMAVFPRAHLDAAGDRRHSIDITSPTSEISSKHVPKTFAAIRSSRLNPAFQAPANIETTKGVHGYMWGVPPSSEGPEVQKRRSASIQPSWGKSWLTGSSSASSPSSQPLEDDLVMEAALPGLDEANGRKRASFSAVPKPIKRVTEAIKRHRAPSLEKTLKLQEKLQALQAQFKSQQKAKGDMDATPTATSLASSPALPPSSLSAGTSPAVLPAAFRAVSHDPPPFVLGSREEAMQMDEEDPTALPDFVPINVTSTSSSLSMVFAGGAAPSQTAPHRNGWTANKGQGGLKRGTKPMHAKKGLTSPSLSAYTQPPPPPARHEQYAMHTSMPYEGGDARVGPSSYAYGGAYGAEAREGYSPLRRMSYDPATLRERYHYDAPLPPPPVEKQYYFGYTEAPQGDQRRSTRGGPSYYGASQPLSSLPPSMWKASANDRRGSWQGPTTYHSDQRTPRSFQQGGPMEQDEPNDAFRRQEVTSHQPIYQRDANWSRSYPSRTG